ncbi:unnamed protein product [Arctogadus glacialis]
MLLVLHYFPVVTPPLPAECNDAFSCVSIARPAEQRRSGTKPSLMDHWYRNRGTGPGARLERGAMRRHVWSAGPCDAASRARDGVCSSTVADQEFYGTVADLGSSGTGAVNNVKLPTGWVQFPSVVLQSKGRRN